jgi:hypothetical protein
MGGGGIARGDRCRGSEDSSDDLIALLGDVLDRACELLASPNGSMFEALERTEIACACLRVWLRQNGTQ